MIINIHAPKYIIYVYIAYYISYPTKWFINQVDKSARHELVVLLIAD